MAKQEGNWRGPCLAGAPGILSGSTNGRSWARRDGRVGGWRGGANQAEIGGGEGNCRDQKRKRAGYGEEQERGAIRWCRRRRRRGTAAVMDEDDAWLNGVRVQFERGEDLVPHPEAMSSELRIPLPSREGYRVLQVTYLFSGRLRSAHRASLCMQKESPRSAAKPYCHQLHQPSSALVSPDLTGPSNAQPITHYYVGQTVIVNIASSSSGSIPLIPTVAIAHFAFHPLTHPITTEAPSLFAAQPRGTERTDPPGEGTLVGALATALFCNRETRSGGFPGGFFLLPRASVCPRETIIPGVCICVRRDVRPLLCAMYILPYDSIHPMMQDGYTALPQVYAEPVRKLSSSI
ncbi:hypothetical protein AUP68_03900 [Ilyonectria robusta]